MKRFINLLFISIIYLFGCKSYKKEFTQVSSERDSLIYVADIKDSSIRSFMVSFDEIGNNLDSITQRQAALEPDSILVGELKEDQKERINESIKKINHLLERNRLLIKELKAKVKSKDQRIAELESLANKLSRQIEAKESELMPLKIQLDEKQQDIESLKLTVDTLKANTYGKDSNWKSKIEKLNTAYYVVGTFKSLHFNSIVDMKGGFLGIGKNQMLKQDFKSDAFTKINITRDTSIILNCKEAKIITNHPSDSYVFEKENDTIRTMNINDFDKFWGASKYLVIVRD